MIKDLCGFAINELIPSRLNNCTKDRFIRVFCVALLVFIIEYSSLLCLFLYIVCKCICCGNECCCKCWKTLKSTNKGYFMFVFGRVIGCVFCGYFMYTNSSNISCECKYNHQIDYCGPFQLNQYLQWLWQYCQFYLMLAVIFLTGKCIIKCLIKKRRWYQYKRLIQMVLYQKKRA